jgi:hypothetical protein
VTAIIAAALTVIGEQGDDSDYLGIADASNVILADRHRTTTILTLDQRHFRCLRPLWGASHFTRGPAHPLSGCWPGRPDSAAHASRTGTAVRREMLAVLLGAEPSVRMLGALRSGLRAEP